MNIRIFFNNTNENSKNTRVSPPRHFIIQNHASSSPPSMHISTRRAHRCQAAYIHCICIHVYYTDTAPSSCSPDPRATRFMLAQRIARPSLFRARMRHCKSAQARNRASITRPFGVAKCARERGERKDGGFVVVLES